MKSSRQFTNLFVSSASTKNSVSSSRIYSFAKEHQPLKSVDKYYLEQNIYGISNKVHNQNIYENLTLQKQPQSNIYESKIQPCNIYTLNRSKSQIIQPTLFSKQKASQFDSLSSSKDLGSSKISQITFSKPSQFITNLQKPQAFINSSTKIVFSPPKTIHDDYGINLVNSSVLKPFKGEIKCLINIQPKGSANQSFNGEDLYALKKNVIQKEGYRISCTRNNKKWDKNQIQKNLYPTQLFVKNQNVISQLKRCASTISINSTRWISVSPSVKINFHYISPTKSESKRKLSFIKEELKNPVSKIMNKKKLLKNKQTQPGNINKINDVVNEYFPEFKVKRNKMTFKMNEKKKTVSIIKKKQTQSEKNFEDQEKKHTFIAGLQGFSQISQIKQEQKQMSTSLSETPKNDVTRTNKSSKIKKQHEVNQKIQNQLIVNSFNFICPKIDCKNIGAAINQKFYSQQNNLLIQNSFKQSQLSLNSIKNVDQSQFFKQAQDSSLTTDYDEDIVKKIKNDLKLNFSYHKK